MKKGGTGGSHTLTGLEYEAKVDLCDFLVDQEGYSVIVDNVYFGDKLVARLFKKHSLYKFLKQNKINWKEHISKQLLPDNCIYVIATNTAYILEVKHQQTNGSVDEKLQTCDFKKKEYIKLFSEFNCKVKYYYVLDEWFNHPKYKDVLDYIDTVDCKYYFTRIPLQDLGLPIL